MAKQPVPFGEWRPDIALLDNEFANDVENVFVDANSYKPIPSLKPFQNVALPGRCAGLASARTLLGDWKLYAGTITGLYEWNGVAWVDRSRTIGGPYSIPPDELWSFSQFGDNLVAVASENKPQVLNISSGTAFADLAGSPPLAHQVTQIGDFLFLGGLDSNRRKIRWSAVNDVTGWIPGTNLCDEQEFPDGGNVQGVAGGEVGYVVQDRAIRTLQFLPGDTTFIFSFARVVQDKGSVSEFGYVCVANILYWLAEDGFYALAGNQLAPIGQDKVNEWFLANSDEGRRNLVQCVATNRPYVAWAYHSNSSVQFYDRLIIFNWSNQKWTRAAINAQAWAQIATINLDLDTDGPEPGDPDLDSNAMPLDSFAYLGGRPKLAAVDENGVLGTLDGPNLQATIETGEAHLVPGRRAFINEVYPLADASGGLVYVAARERLQDPIVWGQANPLEITGAASVLSSARLSRFRLILPRGQLWTHAQGVLADAQPDGMA